MIYILDTNIIRKLPFHFPKKGKLFEAVWVSLEAGIEAETYISVDECFNELSGQFSKDNDAFKWINEHKRMFKNPDGAETLIIRELFKDPKMRESIPIQIIAEAKHFARKFNSSPVERSCVMPLAADIHPHNQSRFCHLHYLAILSINHLEPPVRCGYYHLLGCNLSLPRGSFFSIRNFYGLQEW